MFEVLTILLQAAAKAAAKKAAAKAKVRKFVLNVGKFDEAFTGCCEICCKESCGQSESGNTIHSLSDGCSECLCRPRKRFYEFQIFSFSWVMVSVSGCKGLFLLSRSCCVVCFLLCSFAGGEGCRKKGVNFFSIFGERF